jgi:predicted membrane protein
MITWFGILILVFTIFLIIVVAIDIYYANRIREGGAFSSGTSAAIMWLNFFALLFLIVMLVLSIWYLVSRPKDSRVCDTPRVREAKVVIEKAQPKTVTTTETIPVSVVRQVPTASEATFYTQPSGMSQVTRLEESTY